MVDPDECEPGEFAEAVGRAVISWQNVESSSAHLFSHLLVARSLGAWGVFYHVKNQSTRIEFLNIAARFLFHSADEKELHEKWKLLSPRLAAASALRNRMAHFEIDETMTPTGWKFTLSPPRLDWSQLDPAQPERWSQRQRQRVLRYSQIKDAWRDFEKLGDDLNDFANEVCSWNLKRVQSGASELSKLPHAHEVDAGQIVLGGHHRPRPRKRKASAIKPKGKGT